MTDELIGQMVGATLMVLKSGLPHFCAMLKG